MQSDSAVPSNASNGERFSRLDRENPSHAALVARVGAIKDQADERHGSRALVAAVANVVQDFFLHVYWAQNLGVCADKLEKDGRLRELEVRDLATKIATRDALLAAAKDAPDPPVESKRIVATCRDFSLLACALLRQFDVPARCRCGFAAYFAEATFEDHWVAEYWTGERWALLDAQLDEMQRRALGVRFDPLDVPRDQFLVAGTCYLWAIHGKVDPSRFGIFAIRGLPIITGNVCRDLAALHGVETLPWDGWKMLLKAELAEEDKELVRKIAQSTALSPVPMGDELRELWNDERVHVRDDFDAFVDLRKR